MAKRVPWDPHFTVGDAALDDQHKHLLDQCNALADCLEEDNPAAEKRFDEVFASLMRDARAHFAAEEQRLSACGFPDLDNHRTEQEEFAYLADEIITTENFDRIELQTFLALWWTGHILGAAKNYRSWLSSAA